MSISDPTIEDADGGGFIVDAKFNAGDKIIPVYIRPQGSKEEFAEAVCDAAERFHNLFIEMVQSKATGLDAALVAMSSSFGGAVGGAAQQQGMSHQDMQQMLATYLNSTLASADATYRMHEGAGGE